MEIVYESGNRRFGIRNKKGIFFTILAIIIISLFALSYSFFSATNEREGVQKRVETLNNYVFSVEEDISRNLFISGFRTLFLAEQDILGTGQSIYNFTQTFEESFFNGTYKQVNQPLMDGATLADMTEILIESSNKINANLTLQNVSVYVTQDDPWNVKVVMISRLIIEDKDNLVRWDKDSLISAYIPIKHFNNPLYLMDADVKDEIPSKMIPTPYDPQSGIADLTAHVVDSYYINNTNAPSFLDRLEGRDTSSQYGIEALINVEKLNTAGIAVKTKSVRDWIYFSDSDPRPICKVNLDPPLTYIWLDKPEGIDFYGVSGQEYGCI